MSTPAIHVSHLSKHFQVYQKEAGLWGSLKSLWSREYHTVQAVDDISFEIQPGEVIGFIGQNGAGKTTTLKMLSGLLHPTHGEVTVLGYQPWQRQAAFQKQFALVMGQKNQLWWDLPAMETFLLNQAIYEVPEAQFRQTLHKLTELLEVADVINVQVRKLSLGQRMKCELIAALLHNPRVLFLDEPTIGLDVVMQKVLRDFIKQYNREFGATIILTSHYMGDVKELCQRVIVIDRGHKVYDGQLQQIIDQYAQNKILSLIFSEQVSEHTLAKYGQVKQYEYPAATLLVPRTQATTVAAQLLKKLPVADVNIEEPSIDAIIREMFEQNTAVQKTQMVARSK